jgi:hypothetical protein
MNFANHVQYPGMVSRFRILALVGNGFDIQVLSNYSQRPSTRYVDFYHFMKMRGVDSRNVILAQMEGLLERDAKASQDGTWSDVELAIDHLIKSGTPAQSIRAPLAEVRREFSAFLNGVVSDDLLSRLDADAESKSWAMRSLTGLLSDIETLGDLNKIPFGHREMNKDLYDFLFVNFNYTPLLDNYMYLDQSQFDPHLHTSSGTNFLLNADPRGLRENSEWKYPTYNFVSARVVHPHGYQDVPRSLLFGVGGESDLRTDEAKLEKTYWTHANLNYGPTIGETDLFVIFGCSLGETDSWWWKNIAKALLRGTSKGAILYWWNRSGDNLKTQDEVFQKFCSAASVDEADKEALRERVCIVSYSVGSPRAWLAMPDAVKNANGNPFA